VRYILGLIIKTAHESIVLVRKNAEQCKQRVTKDIGSSVPAGKFEGSTKAVFEHVSPATVFHRPNFIKQDVGHETDENGDRFEESQVHVFAGADQEREQGSR
jgi:hypothetical protein